MNQLATHLGRGEHTQVVECAKLVVRDRPDDKIALALMAKSLERLGDHEEAANVRRLVLEIDPQDRESLYLLGLRHERAGDHEGAADLYERFLKSPEPSYPLQDSDYRFIRFLARIVGGNAKNIEHAARDASLRIDQDTVDREKHACSYLSVRARRRIKPLDA